MYIRDQDAQLHSACCLTFQIFGRSGSALVDMYHITEALQMFYSCTQYAAYRVWVKQLVIHTHCYQRHLDLCRPLIYPG